MIKQKYKDKIGYDHWMCNPEITEKKRKTYLKNWGVSNPFKSPEIKLKIVDTLVARYGTKSSWLANKGGNFFKSISRII